MKKEFPFMPFYTQDWLADDKVSAYSYEEKGVYHEILVCRHCNSSKGSQVPNEQ